MDNHNMAGAMYYRVPNDEETDLTECRITCSCGEHSYGVSFDAQRARQRAEGEWREHRLMVSKNAERVYA